MCRRISDDERRSLTHGRSATGFRLQRRIDARKGANLTYQSTFVVLEAIRVYIANPRRDKIAAVICARYNSRHEGQPLWRRCSDFAWKLKQLFRGEMNPFHCSDWYDDGRGRRKSRSDSGETMGEHAAPEGNDVARKEG